MGRDDCKRQSRAAWLVSPKSRRARSIPPVRYASIYKKHASILNIAVRERTNKAVMDIGMKAIIKDTKGIENTPTRDSPVTGRVTTTAVAIAIIVIIIKARE
jgi:hypothetical protein